MRRGFSNLLLLSLSLSAAFFAGEVMTRFFVDPADYLTVTLEGDDVLGYHVKEPPSGYDEWGFRNDRVESRYDIVAIGDSQTFGNNASKQEAWPKQVERILGEKVYNLSLGGYGPPQYFYLLKERALALNPKRVILGFYLGNDIFDAYSLVYRHRYWSYLRNPEIPLEEEPAAELIVGGLGETRRGVFESVRAYLSRHSVLYRLVVHGPVLGRLQRKVRLAFGDDGDEDHLRIRDERQGLDEGFTPRHRLELLALDDPRVAEGLRISCELIREMAALCRERGVELDVLIIPTKEMVFEPFVRESRSAAVDHVFEELLENERAATKRLEQFLVSEGIPYIEALEPLREDCRRERIYPENYDGHPNRNGYRVIAEGVARFLKERGAGSGDSSG